MSDDKGTFDCIVHDRKRSKKKKVIDPNRCEFTIPNKKRRCGMTRRNNRRFCLDHLRLLKDDKEEDRIPCPLDPKHTVWVKDLEIHFRKCNARPAEDHEPWYRQNFNTILRSDPTSVTNLIRKFSSDEYENSFEIQDSIYIALLKYNDTLKPLVEKIDRHPGLDNWVDAKDNKKHILQHSYLAAVLKSQDLLSSENFYVEFGCGKGELSRKINACILSEIPENTKDTESASVQTYGYGFIDRGTNRMKVDNKILLECESKGINAFVKRSRIDIEHLIIDKFLESINPSSIVGISKHLCGVATDLTIKCILNLNTTLANLKGLVVAMCCRHVCDYHQLLPESREYLTQSGILDEGMFNSLKKIVAWAACGTKTSQEVLDGTIEKEQLGLIARTLIDNSRVYAINQRMPSFQAKLIRYAKKEVTLENHCLHITRRGSS